MLRNSTLIIFIVLCTLSFPAWSQSKSLPETTEGASKVVKAYPNPATSKIYFEIQRNNDKVYEIIVYNFLGKKMDHIKNLAGRTEVPLDNYYSGLYIFQLREKNGTLVESGKFNVVK
ncbi:T9SS type A sorting domain-containing protein [Chitinophaga barathri]|uniref:T9SS C-terminal target domain-containing protein n=1 Tax=Chitinophaga barathri TaxID=1647451 RepID=A0A3N4M6W1_9BACT|nr:T9SS type A sorting domain-containing protein [Chitinophaga barathri]RPD38948.1 T9SS C-terminal target domain-containing protein [Chitinophaga barathri]